MTTFIADYIFGKRDQRPRSRPSPAERLLAHLRPAGRPQPDVGAAESHGESDPHAAPSRRGAGPRRAGDGLAG